MTIFRTILVFAIVLIVITQTFARAKPFHLTPDRVDKAHPPVKIKVEKKDGDMHEFRLVLIWTKTDNVSVGSGTLTVVDAEGRNVMSCAVASTARRENFVIYEFSVAAKYLQKSKFEYIVATHGVDPPYRAARTNCWFELGDFCKPK